MSEDPRNRVLGVEIQQIFVCKIKSSPDAAEAYPLFQSINFDLASRGNKQALIDADFGWNTQSSYRDLKMAA